MSGAETDLPFIGTDFVKTSVTNPANRSLQAAYRSVLTASARAHFGHIFDELSTEMSRFLTVVALSSWSFLLQSIPVLDRPTLRVWFGYEIASWGAS